MNNDISTGNKHHLWPQLSIRSRVVTSYIYQIFEIPWSIGRAVQSTEDVHFIFFSLSIRDYLLMNSEQFNIQSIIGTDTSIKFLSIKLKVLLRTDESHNVRVQPLRFVRRQRNIILYYPY